MKLNILMTIYNEADFVDYAIKSLLSSPIVNKIFIVEGAYQESIKLGANQRSDDGTLEIVKKYQDNNRIEFFEANEQSDPDQRNFALKQIKKDDEDCWTLIVDGDEVWTQTNLKLLANLCVQLEKQNVYAAYFTSLTFVNDLKHYCKQEFPRLFKVTKESKFVNDNFMEWPDKNIKWQHPHVIKVPYIQYHHYSFCKSHSRFKLKKQWWETRFGKQFDYSWYIDDNGKIVDPNHQIFEYSSKHPDEMKNHNLWKSAYEKI